jgi:hypothetical protein
VHVLAGHEEVVGEEPPQVAERSRWMQKRDGALPRRLVGLACWEAADFGLGDMATQRPWAVRESDVLAGGDDPGFTRPWRGARCICVR